MRYVNARSTWALAACTGLVASQHEDAFAQDGDLLDLPTREVDLSGSQEGGVTRTVFCACGGSFHSTGIAPSRLAADDFTINPGLGAAAPFDLNGRVIALAHPSSGTNNSASVRVRVYDVFTGWIVGTFPGASLVGTATYDLADFLEPGYVSVSTQAVAFPGGAELSLNDASAMYTLEALGYQSPLPHVSANFIARGTSTAPVLTVGTSDAVRWVDGDSNGIISGPAPSPEILGGAAQYRAIFVGFTASIPCPTMPISTDLGTLTNSTAAVFGTTSATAPVWYAITLASGATDQLRRFLDVDSEGSAADTAIAIYSTADDTCARLAGNRDSLEFSTGSDGNSGSGTNAQLTFGVGRREAFGDGREYDGRDGELIAGTYLIAVAPGGTSFRDGYGATIPVGAPTGAFTLRLHTNTNGEQLQAARQPAQLVQDAGCLSNQAMVPGTAYHSAPFEIGWYMFSVPTVPASGNQYLDIDFSRTALPADGVASIFDCNGELIATSDDGVASVYFQPAFSFGSASPARTHGAAPAGLYDGQSGALQAGTYWLGMGLYPVSTLTLHDRFHLRSGGASSLDIIPDFYPSVTGSCGTCPPVCDPIDFNNDGVSPDSSDITDFLSVFSGGACNNDPNCNGIDFNNDGVSPDSADIASFLRVFAGGEC